MEGLNPSQKQTQRCRNFLCLTPQALPETVLQTIVIAIAKPMSDLSFAMLCYALKLRPIPVLYLKHP